MIDGPAEPGPPISWCMVKRINAYIHRYLLVSVMSRIRCLKKDIAEIKLHIFSNFLLRYLRRCLAHSLHDFKIGTL